jgi:hypothetical protein
LILEIIIRYKYDVDKKIHLTVLVLNIIFKELDFCMIGMNGDFTYFSLFGEK